MKYRFFVAYVVYVKIYDSTACDLWKLRFENIEAKCGDGTFRAT